MTTENKIHISCDECVKRTRPKADVGCYDADSCFGKWMGSSYERKNYEPYPQNAPTGKYKAGDILRVKYPGNRHAHLVDRDGVLFAEFDDELKSMPLQNWIMYAPYELEKAEDTFKAYDKLRDALKDNEMASKVAHDVNGCSCVRCRIAAFAAAVIKKIEELK